MISVPSACARKIIDIHGQAGVDWLARLPEILASCAKRWSLTLFPPFEDLSYNYVTPAASADGSQVVLKAGVPHPELWREMEALRLFGGVGIARMLDADPQAGVILLERLLPGSPLNRLTDDELITNAAAWVMLRLWKPAPEKHNLATVAGWAKGLENLRCHFGGGYGPFPSRLVDKAEGLFHDHLASSNEAMLIHGDLHPQNILLHKDNTWLAIDPKGVVGPPLYDVATFLNSATDAPGETQRKRILGRRVDLLSDLLGFERCMLISWGMAQAVLSGWWSYEDHGMGWEAAFALADLYSSIK